MYNLSKERSWVYFFLRVKEELAKLLELYIENNPGHFLSSLSDIDLIISRP